MNDPTSSFKLPPPRYLLESDSSDEEGQGDYPGAPRANPLAGTSGSTASKPLRLADVRCQGLQSLGNAGYAEVVVAVGQAGRYALRKLGMGKGHGHEHEHGHGQGRVVIPAVGGAKDERVGAAYDVQGKEGQSGALLIVVEEQEGERAWAVAKGLVQSLKADKWTILTTYLPSTYIPSERDTRFHRSDPPVRAIRPPGTSGVPTDNLGEWASPNYLTGVAAAIFSLAAQPSTLQLSLAHLTTLLLPLPLSSLSNSAYRSALDLASPALAGAGAATATATAAVAKGKARWDEADDEPYVAPGMGGRQQRGDARLEGREEVGGMYM